MKPKFLVITLKGNSDRNVLRSQRNKKNSALSLGVISAPPLTHPVACSTLAQNQASGVDKETGFLSAVILIGS